MRFVILQIFLLFLLEGLARAELFKVPGSQQRAVHSAARWTNDYQGVVVEAGDVVVLQAATNKRRSLTEYSTVVTASTAQLQGPVSVQSAVDTNPGSHIFYYHVVYPGSVDLRVHANANSTAESCVFVLRSDAGAPIEALSTASLDAPVLGTNEMVHTFGSSTAGFLVESFSSTSDSIVSHQLDAEINEDLVRNTLNKRILTGGTFSDAASLTSVSVVTNERVSAVSVVFSEGAVPVRPNILFIAVDDMKPLLGCYGNSFIETPHMDSLAAGGMVFLNAHCQWSVCGPSRASLMTGLMPEQCGVMGFTKMRGNAVDDARDNPIGLPNVLTLPQYFAGWGYATAAVGKLNDDRCVGSINADGSVNEDGNVVDDPPSWSHSFNNPSGLQPSKAIRVTDGANIKLAAESVDRPETDFVDGKIAGRALTVLNELAVGAQPFFLGVGFKKPHLPFLAPTASWDRYEPDQLDIHPFQESMTNVTPYTFNAVMELRNSYYFETNSLGQALPIPTNTLAETEQQWLLNGYYACVSHIDDQVGRMLDELDRLGLASNTVVVLWGDHGFHLGDHNEWGKHTNLEQATRVPLIIKAPGYPAGVHSQAPAGLIDLFPTLCDLAGFPVPEQPVDSSVSGGRPLSGHSLVPVLSDPAARVQTGVMHHYGSFNFGYGYRTERYRYTEWINGAGNVLARELYDYHVDPLETINLAGLPGYDALMHQFAVATRSAGEARGSERLKGSMPLALPADRSLSGVEISEGHITWPDASGITYSLLSKTNLMGGVWTVEHGSLLESPAPVNPVRPRAFYKVEVNE